MRSLAITNYATPDKYNVIDLPTPSIHSPGEILIKVHAASINPIDVKLASGMAKLLQKKTFPYKIGLDVSGTVAAIGDGITKFKVGDEVYGALRDDTRGSASDWALASQDVVALKTPKLTHVEAASLPIVAITALQALDKADAQVPGGLKDKTIFVPAGLSGTGSIALQLAKNVFGAGKVITTVSTAKVAKVTTLLGSGVVDQIVDYTIQDPLKEIPIGSVDFMFDTMGGTLGYVSLLKPKTGRIISIATVPDGNAITRTVPDVPFFVKYVFNLANWFYTWRVGRWGVSYEWLGAEINGENLARLAAIVGEGKVKPVVGKVVKLSDLEAVRGGCTEIYQGHGGVGKLVIEVD